MWPILSHFMSNRYAVKSKVRLLIELYNLLTCAPLGGHSLSTQAPQKGHSLTSCLRKGGRIDSTSSVHLSISLSVRPSVRPSVHFRPLSAPCLPDYSPISVTFGHFRPRVCPITAKSRSLSAIFWDMLEQNRIIRGWAISRQSSYESRELLARGLSGTLNRRSFSHTDRILLQHILFFAPGPDLNKSFSQLFAQNFFWPFPPSFSKNGKKSEHFSLESRYLNSANPQVAIL